MVRVGRDVDAIRRWSLRKGSRVVGSEIVERDVLSFDALCRRSQGGRCLSLAPTAYRVDSERPYG